MSIGMAFVITTFLSILFVFHELPDASGFLLEPNQGDDVVQTTCGPVRGNISDGVYVFAGIPYALPPTGSRRWRPPVPLSPQTKTCWNGVYNATQFSSICFQPKFGRFTEFEGSEDCLFLNVWTPTLDPNANLPVLVWIHGGFLLFASGTWKLYSPTEAFTSKTNMVFVSMNYRLNAFGFMALNILSEEAPTKTSGNYGFRDQILALEWVKLNIKQFGGNPNSVTAYGQSSGGTSLFALLASPLAKNLFQRAWLISASPILNKTLEDASRDNLAFLKNTNCSDVDCLRGPTPTQVCESIPWFTYPYWAMQDQAGLPEKNVFDGAVAIVDGVVIPSAPFDAWKNGKGNDVPIVIGTTAQETDFAPTEETVNKWTWTDYTNYVHKKLDTFGKNISDQALEMYPPLLTPEYQYTTMSSDLRVTCPNDIMAAKAANAFKSSVWRYVVTSFPSKPVHPIGAPFPSRYAFHMWDYIAFSDFISDYIDSPSPNDVLFQMIMQREMLSFIRTGRVSSSNWKPYPESTAILDTSIRVSPGVFKPKECQFWTQNNFFSYAWIN